MLQLRLVTRLALPLVLLLTAAHVPAQSPGEVSGTWYTSPPSHVLPSADSASTTPLAAHSLVTLELRVEGPLVMGEERRELSIPTGETKSREAPLTVTTVREVNGTHDGSTVRLTMKASYGPALVYEGTLSPDGRHLTLRLVPDATIRGETPPAEVPPVTYDRQPPKPRRVK